MTNEEKKYLEKRLKEFKDELRREVWGGADESLKNHTSNKDILGITFVTMSENGTIDAVTAAEHTELFAEWEIGVNYAANNIRKRGDKLHLCLQPHTSQEGWEPENAPSLWRQIGDPTEEYPEWSQPVGAGDAYGVGDKCSHNGKHWVSDVDGNVWEPGVYGWSEV